MLMGPCNNLVSSEPSKKNGYACLSRDAELPKPESPGRGRGQTVTVSLVDYSNRESLFLSLAALGRTGPGLTRSIMIIGLIGGALFLLAGFLTLLPWTLSGSIAGVLLGSWFGGEIKKRLGRGNEGGKETRVIRFRKKALLEDNVSEMRTAGWEPRWESYRETQTGLLVRRIVYSVVMERKQRKRRGLKQLSKFLFPSKQHS